MASSPCEDGNGPKTLCEVQLSPAVSAIAIGAQLRLSAIAIYSDKSKLDVTSSARWSSSNSNTATISDSDTDKGSVLGLMEGVVVITASYANKQSFIPLNVNKAQLLSIELSKVNIALANGTQTTVQAVGHYSDNTRYDISNVVAWSIDDTGIASLAVGSVATVSGVSSGNTVLRVSYEGATVSTGLSVTGATLDAIVIEPDETSLALGNAARLTAIGYYSDGEIEDISGQVSWISNDDSVVGIDVITGKNGAPTAVISAKQAGTATIMASLNGISANSIITVTGAVLMDISIIPPLTSIANGSQVQFRATGLYSDYTTVDITSAVTWASSDVTIATIDNASNSAGLLSARAVGKVQIVAALDDVVITQDLSVTNAEIVGLNISSERTTVAAGSILAFKAMASFLDGSIQDVTEFVAWSFTDNAIATIISDQSGRGNLKTLKPGGGAIVAVYKGKTANTVVTVTAAVLTSISIDSADLTLAKGTSAKLTITGHYSDASAEDISNAIVWTSSQSAIASISTLGGESGTLLAKSLGTTTITANIPGNVGITDSITVTVTEALLQSITITQQNIAIPNNSTIQLAAQGHYSDATIQDITRQVTWSSLAPEIAQVSNVSGSKGLVYGVADSTTGDGATQIIAAVNNESGVVQGSTNITVTYEPQRPVNITLFAMPNVILSDGVDHATIQVSLKASESGAMVADGTVIEFEIVGGTGQLSTTTATSMDGVAQVDLTSNADSLVVVKATIQNTSITNTVVVNSTAAFANVLLKYSFADYVYDGATNIVKGDSSFILYVQNLSNRTFKLDKYEFTNGAAVLRTIVDFAVVQNQLKPGATYGVRLNVQPQMLNNGLTAKFTISDPVTGQSFVVSHTYNLVP